MFTHAFLATRLISGQSTAEILRSFQEIKSDYQSVVEEVQRLQDSQKEALKNILDQLQRAHKTEEALKASLGDNKEQ